MAEQDRLALQQFVSEFDRFLALAVQPSRLLPDDRSRELSEAYQEVSAAGLVAEVHAALGDPRLDEPEPPSTSGGIGRSRLETFGLTGASLRSKLAGWARAFARLSAAGSPVLAFFRSAFRWANTILGSIIAALGLGEALKELKETVENSYEDAAEGI